MTSISSYALTASPRLTVAQAQASLSRAQAELASGKLADIGLGLGSGTGTYVALAAQGSGLQAMVDANATTSTTLAAATAGLDALRSTATSFLSSLTEAATAGNTPGTLVATAGSNLDALTSTLNTAVGATAVFGGVNASHAPMTAYTAGSPAKSAVDSRYAAYFKGQDPATISKAQMQGYLSGSFADLFTKDNYQGTWSAAGDAATAQVSTTEKVATSVSANDDPFRQLAQAYAMVKEYGGSDFSSDAGQAVVASATQLVSSAIAGLTDAGARVGQAQSTVSDADDRMTAQIGYLSSRSGGLVDVDASALAAEISGLQTQIQASYEVTSQLQQLSLVNYLK